MLSRRAYVDVIYEGINITEYLVNDLISFTYTDNASDSADDISIVLQDKRKKWINAWAPVTGDTINAAIKTINWSFEGDNKALGCGDYLVDEISYSGRPLIVSIGAISMPANTDFTTVSKSRTWEKANIKKIAQSIANSNSIELIFDSTINPDVDFVEQSETSDMAFLYELCKKNGLSMKMYSNKIIIFSEAEYEQKPTVALIKENNMISWNGKTSLTDTGYSGCTVTYFDPITSQELQYTFTIEAAKNKIYKINETVSSIAEAERLAKSKLRELNKAQNQISITILGDTSLVASNCVEIHGLGRFDGKYYIDKIQHSLPSYQCQLELHKVMEGY